jgi:hypothetical protein
MPAPPRSRSVIAQRLRLTPVVDRRRRRRARCARLQEAMVREFCARRAHRAAPARARRLAHALDLGGLVRARAGSDGRAARRATPMPTAPTGLKLMTAAALEAARLPRRTACSPTPRTPTCWQWSRSAFRPGAADRSATSTCWAAANSPGAQAPATACTRRALSTRTERTPMLLFSSEHEIFRDAVRRFIADEIAPHHASGSASRHRAARACGCKAGEAGLLCCAVPEAYGGAGRRLPLRRGGVRGDGARRRHRPGLHDPCDLVATYIASFGTEAQKRGGCRRWCAARPSARSA